MTKSDSEKECGCPEGLHKCEYCHEIGEDGICRNPDCEMGDETDSDVCAECGIALDTTFGNICENCAEAQ